MVGVDGGLVVESVVVDIVSVEDNIGDGVVGSEVVGTGVTEEGVIGDGVTGDGVTGLGVVGTGVTGDGVTGLGVVGDTMYKLTDTFQGQMNSDDSSRFTWYHCRLQSCIIFHGQFKSKNIQILADSFTHNVYVQI